MNEDSQLNIKDVINAVDKLETNLVREVNDLHASTDVVFKELTLYLYTSANDISSIKDDNKNSALLLKKIIDYLNKLNLIEDQITSLPKELNKIYIKILETGKLNSTNLSKLYKMLNNKILAIEKSIKDEISAQKKVIDLTQSQINKLIDNIDINNKKSLEGQKQLVEIINSLIQNKQDIIETKADLEKSKIKSNTSKYKAKINLWMKIIGGLLGSSGILWFIIEIIKRMK